MRYIFRKLLSMVTHVQVLAVLFAFGLMVFLSYYFMSDIERKHLLTKVSNAMNNTQYLINSELLDVELSLSIISETIRAQITAGRNYGMVNTYIRDISRFMTEDITLIPFSSGIYGYFPAIDGIFCSRRGFMPQNDSDLKNLPWYYPAIYAEGNVIRTDPVPIIDEDADIYKVSITFARGIHDDNGVLLGIICMDKTIDRIQKYAIDTYISEGSYGILMDQYLNVIAHPIPSRFLGRNLRLMNDGEAIVEILMNGGKISERKVWDYNRVESVGFFEWLDNGWCLAIIAYSDKYYQSVRDIGTLLVILGAALALVLIAILLSVVAGKKRAEERTQLMLDTVPLCAGIWDSNRNILECNLEAVKLFGLSNKREYQEKFFELSPEYQPDGNKSREKALEQIKKAFDEGFNHFEWVHRKLNGELVPSEIILVRVMFRNEHMICAYTRDLRELKAIMATMREADECRQVMFDATPLSCFMIDKRFKVLESNEEIERLFGLSSKNEFIDDIFRFFPKYQPSGQSSDEMIKIYIDEALEEGFCRFEWMLQKLDGEQIPAEVSLVRVKFKGEYTIAGYVRDLRELKNMIAEMRRAEIAEESNKAKSDFLAKMSHEIRTPMNAIMGITEIQLQDNTLTLATKEALERIYNSGDLLLGIINDILDLSKIEAGKLELASTQYDIASLIYDTVKLNIMRYESKPIDFRLEVDEKIPAALVGDELRIKQILNNLLSNAFKYTQEGQVAFTLSAEPQRNNSNWYLTFRVSDTGQGMTSEQVRRLGDKFSRFNLDANRKTEGTGLGMNITRNLIQLMNGEIIVESTPGLGSVFTVRLPQNSVNSGPIGKDLAENLMKLNLKNTTKMRNAQITQEFMPYGKVLVIDDVETNLYVARGLIAPYGITIDTGLSGFEAIDKIRDGENYDIIFMDHMMPRMDGIEAVKIIRSIGYKKPIVALTANALSGQAEMFLNNGFDDFISKPIDIRQLNTVLNRLIRDKQTPDVLEEARKQKNMLYAAGGHNIAIEPQLAEFFVRDAKKAVSVLTAISENNCRREDDIPTFIINVHAMKSALVNVGESDLAAEAGKMEQAGRDKNISLILLSLPEFIESLQKVIEKLDPHDEESEEEEFDSSDSDKEYLKEKLHDIQSACASLSKRAAKEALADIKQKTWPRSTRDQLSAIAEHLLHSEFDEVAAIAKKMIEE